MLLFPYAHRVIREMTAAGATPEAIAMRLKREGVLTKYQSAWSAKAVVRQAARMFVTRRRDARIAVAVT